MAIKFIDLMHQYSKDTPLALTAISDINLDITKGKITAIIGSTGSGKSTLVQHLNALLMPTNGEVVIDDWKITADRKSKDLKTLRKHVGLVFQFPEYQLFEETVEKDVIFGPCNFGVSEQDAKTMASKVIKLVGLEESILEKSPLELSGGQKRRVAIAGILAMEPEVIVLDEPTAGLDPHGSSEIVSLLKKLNKEDKKTIVIVTHDLNQLLKYCDEVVILNKGKLLGKYLVNELFNDDKLMDSLDIEKPNIIKFQIALANKGLKLNKRYFEVNDLAEELSRRIK